MHAHHKAYPPLPQNTTGVSQAAIAAGKTVLAACKDEQQGVVPAAMTAIVAGSLIAAGAVSPDSTTTGGTTQADGLLHTAVQHLATACSSVSVPSDSRALAAAAAVAAAECISTEGSTECGSMGVMGSGSSGGSSFYSAESQGNVTLSGSVQLLQRLEYVSRSKVQHLTGLTRTGGQSYRVGPPGGLHDIRLGTLSCQVSTPAGEGSQLLHTCSDSLVLSQHIAKHAGFGGSYVTRMWRVQSATAPNGVMDVSNTDGIAKQLQRTMHEGSKVGGLMQELGQLAHAGLGGGQSVLTLLQAARPATMTPCGPNHMSVSHNTTAVEGLRVQDMFSMLAAVDGPLLKEAKKDPRIAEPLQVCESCGLLISIVAVCVSVSSVIVFDEWCVCGGGGHGFDTDVRPFCLPVCPVCHVPCAAVCLACSAGVSSLPPAADCCLQGRTVAASSAS